MSNDGDDGDDGWVMILKKVYQWIVKGVIIFGHYCFVSYMCYTNSGSGPVSIVNLVIF